MHEAVRAVLTLAVRAIDADRGFLVVGDGAAAPRVVARTTPGRADQTPPSRSLLCAALAAREPGLFNDPGTVADLARGASVRSLELRAAALAPVPGSPGPAAVVLDSRRALAGSTSRLLRILAEVAEAIGASLPPPPPGPPDDAEGLLAAAAEHGLVGRSDAFRGMLAAVRKAATYGLPVVVHGESGSGKEGVARLLHAWSPRADAPFLAFNCAAVPEPLIESELFGAERGAYTGAVRDHPGLFRAADGGTVVLDEVGDMPAAMQAKLLRVLQGGRFRALGGRREIDVDVRVVAASHRDLRALAARDLFREDLLHRLDVLRVEVPPLRARTEDLPDLVLRITRHLERTAGVPPPALAACAFERLRLHSWPGNVRELESVLARAAVRCAGGTAFAADLEISDAHQGPRRERRPPSLEATLIEDALRAEAGNVTAAAARLGWSRQRMYRRMMALSVDG